MALDVDRIRPDPLVASGAARIRRALLAALVAALILPALLVALVDGATALDCCGSRWSRQPERDASVMVSR